MISHHDHRRLRRPERLDGEFWPFRGMNKEANKAVGCRQIEARRDLTAQGCCSFAWPALGLLGKPNSSNSPRQKVTSWPSILRHKQARRLARLRQLSSLAGAETAPLFVCRLREFGSAFEAAESRPMVSFSFRRLRTKSRREKIALEPSEPERPTGGLFCLAR